MPSYVEHYDGLQHAHRALVEHLPRYREERQRCLDAIAAIKLHNSAIEAVLTSDTDVDEEETPSRASGSKNRNSVSDTPVVRQQSAPSQVIASRGSVLLPVLQMLAKHPQGMRLGALMSSLGIKNKSQKKNAISNPKRTGYVELRGGLYFLTSRGASRLQQSLTDLAPVKTPAGASEKHE